MSPEVVGSAVREAGRPRHRHSPRVRRLAAEAGLSLESVSGTGPTGRVTPDDVRRATAPTAATVLTLAMPPSTSGVEVDLSVLSRRAETVTAQLVKAVVEAWRGRTGQVAFGVDTDRGLVVHALPDAGDLSLVGIEHRIDDLRRGAQDEAPTVGANMDGALVVCDAHSSGIQWEIPALPPGPLGVLILGATVERPVVVRRADNERVIAIRSMAYLTLTYIERLGRADAGRLLATIKSRLEAGTLGSDPV